ncbi:unnamed protein product, partial [Ixodes persulcatus]
ISVQPSLTAARDKSGKTALHYCAENLTVGCAELLLMVEPGLASVQDEEGYTTLHFAVISGNRTMVRFLVDRGADVSVLDNEKHSCVHWATVCGELECMDILVAAGADPSTPDIHGAYPIHYAAQMCGPNSEMGNDVRVGLAALRRLIQLGVDVSVRDQDGRPPLLWAASVETRPSKTYCSSGSSDAILALVNAGADVSATDKDGLTDQLNSLTSVHCGGTAVGTAHAQTHQSSRIWFVRTPHAQCPHLVAKRVATVLRLDRPAHCGAAKGQSETLKILAQHGANLYMRNLRGDLPLHEAVQSGRKDLVQWLLELQPSAVNSPNNNGRSALHVAAIANSVEMCKVLMDKGAEVNPVMRNNKGQLMTPLDASLQRGNRGCAKYLRLHGALPFCKMTDRHDIDRWLEHSFNINKLHQTEQLCDAEAPPPHPVLQLEEHMVETCRHVKTLETSVQTDSGYFESRDFLTGNAGLLTEANVAAITKQGTIVEGGRTLKQAIITNVYVRTSGATRTHQSKRRGKQADEKGPRHDNEDSGSCKSSSGDEQEDHKKTKRRHKGRGVEAEDGLTTKTSKKQVVSDSKGHKVSEEVIMERKEGKEAQVVKRIIRKPSGSDEEVWVSGELEDNMETTPEGFTSVSFSERKSNDALHASSGEELKKTTSRSTELLRAEKQDSGRRPAVSPVVAKAAELREERGSTESLQSVQASEVIEKSSSESRKVVSTKHGESSISLVEDHCTRHSTRTESSNGKEVFHREETKQSTSEKKVLEKPQGNEMEPDVAGKDDTQIPAKVVEAVSDLFSRAQQSSTQQQLDHDEAQQDIDRTSDSAKDIPGHKEKLGDKFETFDSTETAHTDAGPAEVAIPTTVAEAVTDLFNRVQQSSSKVGLKENDKQTDSGLVQETPIESSQEYDGPLAHDIPATVAEAVTDLLCHIQQSSRKSESIELEDPSENTLLQTKATEEQAEKNVLPTKKRVSSDSTTSNKISDIPAGEAQLVTTDNLKKGVALKPSQSRDMANSPVLISKSLVDKACGPSGSFLVDAGCNPRQVSIDKTERSTSPNENEYTVEVSCETVKEATESIACSPALQTTDASCSPENSTLKQFDDATCSPDQPAQKADASCSPDSIGVLDVASSPIKQTEMQDTASSPTSKQLTQDSKCSPIPLDFAKETRSVACSPPDLNFRVQPSDREYSNVAVSPIKPSVFEKSSSPLEAVATNDALSSPVPWSPKVEKGSRPHKAYMKDSSCSPIPEANKGLSLGDGITADMRSPPLDTATAEAVNAARKRFKALVKDASSGTTPVKEVLRAKVVDSSCSPIGFEYQQLSRSSTDSIDVEIPARSSSIEEAEKSPQTDIGAIPAFAEAATSPIEDGTHNTADSVGVLVKPLITDIGTSPLVPASKTIGTSTESKPEPALSDISTSPVDYTRDSTEKLATKDASNSPISIPPSSALAFDGRKIKHVQPNKKRLRKSRSWDVMGFGGPIETLAREIQLPEINGMARGVPKKSSPTTNVSPVQNGSRDSLEKATLEETSHLQKLPAIVKTASTPPDTTATSDARSNVDSPGAVAARKKASLHPIGSKRHSLSQSDLDRSPESSIRSSDHTVTLKDSGFSDVERPHSGSSGEEDRTDHAVSDSAAQQLELQRRKLLLRRKNNKVAESVREQRKRRVPNLRPVSENYKSPEDMTLAVQESIRKYRLERQLFNELQELKRHQIRSGRTHENVLVKRLVDRYRELVLGPGMRDFGGPYTFRNYEMYLYGQLRDLSNSNDGKVPAKYKKVTSNQKPEQASYRSPEASSRTAEAKSTFPFLKKHEGRLSVPKPHDDSKPKLSTATKSHKMTSSESTGAKSQSVLTQSVQLSSTEAKNEDAKETPRRRFSKARSTAPKKSSALLPFWVPHDPSRVDTSKDDSSSARQKSSVRESLGEQAVRFKDWIKSRKSSKTGRRSAATRTTSRISADATEELAREVQLRDGDSSETDSDNVSETGSSPDVASNASDSPSSSGDSSDDGIIEFEIRHGREKNVFWLPTSKMRDNKKWQVTFIVAK